MKRNALAGAMIQAFERWGVGGSNASKAANLALSGVDALKRNHEKLRACCQAAPDVGARGPL